MLGGHVREPRGVDMTQQEFADRTGISQAYLSNVERGKVEVGAEILPRIVREFGRWKTSSVVLASDKA